MSVIDALNWRYAVKKFSQSTLTQMQINDLVESVRLAPSAYGIQPYQLIVVTDPKVKKACLPHSYGQDKVANCSHLLVLAHKKHITHHDISLFIESVSIDQNKPLNALNDYQNQIESDLLVRTTEQQNNWAQQQCYIALGTLLTHAAVSKIDTCPMTGFDVNGINQALGLNDKGLSAAILCPVGIRDQDDHAASRAKTRLSYNDLVVSL
ncbi:NAD(P)H-dependent oxidoreductase [Pseudoalteromonas sp. NBT06-2]|uniref:NAD(P)H-dependent oxidoreductase n=1 Tax=Pseudoalteromonas sp. NBT06-2 TaxID=2025950 RepID=UPI000BA56954|nr:NAD(P)H-dependent oxidoreductase [Pseudoalteromonas sp. NBT06-2]PAJ72084.1 NAD(P)H-dependent oxidoreductase [Pseudoalteromonas sp. NBT06-2]